MSITIGDHVFDGPYTAAEDLTNGPGVFAVIVANGDRGALIDIGESDTVGECVAGHPSKNRWQKFTSEGRLCYAVLHTPTYDQAERSSIEREIRRRYTGNE